MDFDKLKNDLADYYGSAMFSGMPAAAVDLVDVETENNDALLQRAIDNGFDLNQYEDKQSW